MVVVGTSASPHLRWSYDFRTPNKHTNKQNQINTSNIFYASGAMLRRPKLRMLTWPGCRSFWMPFSSCPSAHIHSFLRALHRMHAALDSAWFLLDVWCFCFFKKCLQVRVCQSARCKRWIMMRRLPVLQVRFLFRLRKKRTIPWSSTPSAVEDVEDKV